MAGSFAPYWIRNLIIFFLLPLNWDHVGHGVNGFPIPSPVVTSTQIVVTTKSRFADGLRFVDGSQSSRLPVVPCHRRTSWWERRSSPVRLYQHAQGSTTATVPIRTSPVLPETIPPAPHTFAGMVESGIRERYGTKLSKSTTGNHSTPQGKTTSTAGGDTIVVDGGNDDRKDVNEYDETNVERVLQSWRLTDMGYVHREFIGPTLPTTTDTSLCYQEAPSFVPGLTIQPFWDIKPFPWASKLKSYYRAIRTEFQSVMAQLESNASTNDHPTGQPQSLWAGALSEHAQSYGEGWRTLVLMDRGVWDPDQCRLFPVTAQAIHDCGIPAVEVFFASMQPHTVIKPHSDFTNFVLTCHLAIDIPYSGQNKCRLTVADQTREWINGEVMLFDTSLLHDAVNESDQMRYILMMRIWHPDLTTTERQALQFIYDCLNVPDIVTAPTATERIMVEQQMQQLRCFPAGLSTKEGSAPSMLPKAMGFGTNPTQSKKKKKATSSKKK